MGENWKERFGSEWPYIMKLGAAISDPHDKREFWENIKARKMADESFSIYELFPVSETATEKAKRGFFEAVKRFRKTGGDKDVGQEGTGK